MQPTERRRSAARLITALVANECRNSDLRADNPEILKRLDAAFEALGARIADLAADNARLVGALERVLDAAKSYRSDILGHSVQELGPYFPEMFHAPKWPGRDKSIGIAESALAATPQPEKSAVSRNVEEQQAAIAKAVFDNDYTEMRRLKAIREAIDGAMRSTEGR